MGTPSIKLLHNICWFFLLRNIATSHCVIFCEKQLLCFFEYRRMMNCLFGQDDVECLEGASNITTTIWVVTSYGRKWKEMPSYLLMLTMGELIKIMQLHEKGTLWKHWRKKQLVLVHYVTDILVFYLIYQWLDFEMKFRLLHKNERNSHTTMN